MTAAAAAARRHHQVKYTFNFSETVKNSLENHMEAVHHMLNGSKTHKNNLSKERKAAKKQHSRSASLDSCRQHCCTVICQAAATLGEPVHVSYNFTSMPIVAAKDCYGKCCAQWQTSNSNSNKAGIS